MPSRRARRRGLAGATAAPRPRGALGPAGASARRIGRTPASTAARAAVRRALAVMRRPGRVAEALRLLARRELEQRLEGVARFVDPGARVAAPGKARRHGEQREVGRDRIGHLVPVSGIDTRASGSGRTE